MREHLTYTTESTPANTRYDEWTPAQRRAYLRDELERLGHPHALEVGALARQFDVDPATLQSDLAAIADAVSAQSSSQRDLIAETVYQRAIQALQAEGDHYRAAKVVGMWQEWLMDRGKVEKVAEKRTLNIERTETEAIRVVSAAGDEITDEGGW